MEWQSQESLIIEDVLPRRSRGRPYLRWVDDIQRFSNEKRQNEEWIFAGDVLFLQIDAVEFVDFVIGSTDFSL